MLNELFCDYLGVESIPHEAFCEWHGDKCDTHALYRLTVISGSHHNTTGLFCASCGKEFAAYIGRLPGYSGVIQHPQSDAYTREDLSILQVLANHTALVIQNVRLHHMLSQLDETRPGDSGRPMQATVEDIRTATGAEMVVLYPTRPGHQSFLLPPLIAGEWFDPAFANNFFADWLDKIVTSILDCTEPIFVSTLDALDMILPFKLALMPQREDIKSLAVIPLFVDKEAVGVLCILFRLPQLFDISERLLIMELASFTAVVIRNARTYGALIQRRVHELELLQRIDKELNSALELEPILDTILRLACTFVPAEGAAILLYNTKMQTLEAKSTWGTFASERSALRFTSRDQRRGITWWVLHHKQAARVANVHKGPWSSHYYDVAPETISELDVPLLNGNQAVGVLNFESSKEGVFRQEDQDFIYTLAGQAVLAIAKAQAYEREKRLADQRRVLNEISKEITSQLDPQRVFDLILEKAFLLTESRTGVLMLYDPDQHVLRMVAERGVLPDKKWNAHSLDEGIAGYVARTKELLNIDPSQPPWDSVYLDYIPGTRAELAVPILTRGVVRGVLNIESTEVDAFDDSDERMLQGLADLAAVALRNAELYKEAEKETQHFELLYKASCDLGEINELDQLEQGYEVVYHLAADYSQSNVVLRRYDESNSDLVLIHSIHTQAIAYPTRIGAHEGINGYVTRHCHTVVIDDIHDLATFPPGVSSIKLADPELRSIVVVPILFKGRYYGTLGLSHHQVGYFRGTDIRLYEGFAQQLASTIYRLEATQARMESEQRAKAAEEVSLIGQSAMELTHRLGNDLGLVESYVGDVQRKLVSHSIHDVFIGRKLGGIVQAVRTVLNLSHGLKHILATSNEAVVGDPLLISPEILLEKARSVFALPPDICCKMEIEEDVMNVYVFEKLIDDILFNLMTNAVDAMPDGGVLTLGAHNASNMVAIEVKDTGMGIEPQKITKVFSLFYSTKGSSGFGLWSARRNALRNHGDLYVESDLKEGSTFTLLLPKADDNLPVYDASW